MFKEDFKANRIGNKLFLEYFQGNVVVDVESDAQAHKYLMEQASKLDRLKSNILKQADKFINE